MSLWNNGWRKKEETVPENRCFVLNFENPLAFRGGAGKIEGLSPAGIVLNIALNWMIQNFGRPTRAGRPTLCAARGLSPPAWGGWQA